MDWACLAVERDFDLWEDSEPDPDFDQLVQEFHRIETETSFFRAEECHKNLLRSNSHPQEVYPDDEVLFPPPPRSSSYDLEDLPPSLGARNRYCCPDHSCVRYKFNINCRIRNTTFCSWLTAFTLIQLHIVSSFDPSQRRSTPARYRRVSGQWSGTKSEKITVSSWKPYPR